PGRGADPDRRGGRDRRRPRARARQPCGGGHSCRVRLATRRGDRKRQGELMRVDLRCYAIVDPEVAGGHELPDLCRMLAAGGVTLVQLRDNLSATRVVCDVYSALT